MARYNSAMYHYDPKTALEELAEEATLPNPVHVRDMILRKRLFGRSVAGAETACSSSIRNFSAKTQKLGKRYSRSWWDRRRHSATTDGNGLPE